MAVTPTLLTLLTFLAAALAVAGVYSIAMDLFLRERSRVSQRLDDEFSNRQTGQIRKSPLFKNLEKLGPDAALAKEFRWSLSKHFRGMVEQSGLNLTVGRLLSVCAGTGLALGALGGFFGRSWVIGAGVGVVATGIPVLYVNFKRKRRLEKLLSQLPDAFDLIARLVRTGQTTSQAFQGVADEFEAPISAEFAYCYEQQNLGLPPEVALRDMARRIDLVEIKIFVLAVLVQRQTGGNLAELIDNLSAIVRERFRIRGKIKVMTAEGRMEAAVLLALPPVVFLLILFVNRNYAQILLEHPKVIWGMLGFMFVGVLWIRKIINFDF
jgi:tight adherence protein B